MPNLDLDKKGTYINIPEEFKNFFKGDKISYTNLTTKKNRLENELSENPSDVEKKKLLDWVNKTLKSEAKKIDAPKRSKLNTGGPGGKRGVNGYNIYKKREATKTQEIGSVVAVSESEIKKEIDSIKYLIEYMDNNNKNKI